MSEEEISLDVDVLLEEVPVSDVIPDIVQADDENDEFTDEDLDQIADAAIGAIKTILSYFNLDDVSIDEYEGDESEIILDIVGNGDLALLIGRHGKTLDALQLLVTSIVYKQIGFRYPITIDIEGYKNRRREKLESLAHSSAARAVRQQADVRLRPMSAYERRIIHVCLKDNDLVETVSEGAEPSRYIVIKVL
jgi:spoIIIJ-associated protein